MQACMQATLQASVVLGSLGRKAGSVVPSHCALCGEDLESQVPTPVVGTAREAVVLEEFRWCQDERIHFLLSFTWVSGRIQLVLQLSP